MTLPTATRTQRRAIATDAAVALIAFALTLLVLAHGGASRSLDPLGVVLAALSSFPLLARRRWPLAVFAFTAAASALVNGLGYPTGPPFGPTAALFFVAADDRTRGRVRETAAVVAGVFAVHIAASAHDGFPTSPVLFGIVVWGGAWLIGDQVRQRRQRSVDAQERARGAARETARERRLAVAEERNRIARDLHDSAAHAINVILVHAGAARLLQQRDPEAASVALTTVEEVARETIGEIDQLIRGLREDHDGDEDDGVEPPVGLAALETLAERNRASGLAVEISFEGARRPLAPGLDQAAYRIVQESLTNAARHGSGGAQVEIAYGTRGLELTISNPVAGPAVPGALEGGHGILGMRERSALLGGSLDVGVVGGRFRVHAELPYVGDQEPR